MRTLELVTVVGSISLVSLLAGCPGSEGRVIASCDDVLAWAPAPGAACSFTETCFPDSCGDPVTCVDGRVMRNMTKPCQDAGVPPDAGADAGVADAGVLDASTDATLPLDASDGGSCAPVETATSCRSDGDCRAAFEQCLAPGEFGGCGICMEPMALCVSSADCSGTDVCVTYRPLCTCGGDASECRPRCTETSCEAGESCNASSGLCGPTSCTDGYACPAETECVPASDRADEHGCERNACTTDGQCGCGGACVDGLCFPALGTCSALPA